MTSTEKGAGERLLRLKAICLRAALVLALGLGAGLLTPRTAEAQAYVFNSVQIEGNSRIETATILSYAGIARGQQVTPGQLNDAYQRLVNSGLFEAVAIEPQGGTLVIKVTEYPTINVISIEGNKRLKDEVLRGLIQSEPRKVYSPVTAERDAGAMVDAYESSGRLAARVTPKIIRRSGNRVDLVFEVTEGKVVEIERLSFTGNRDFSDRRLRRVLGTKQAGLLRQIIQRDTYVPERVDFDKQVLRDFYLSRGYIDFQTKSVTSEFSRERNATFVTFNIEEGQSYRFGALSVASEVPEAQEVLGEFERQIKIRRGATYNPALVDTVIARMENLALKKGYTFVRVDPRITRNERAGTLDIAFTLVRGQRIFVERIDIEGNQTTLDRVIRTQFRTVEGDPFNPREIREAAARIRALGFFATADVQAREGSSADQVVVDVNVEEKATGSLSFGATFSQDAGTGITVSFRESNFLGRGQGIAFDLVSTADSNSFTFSFTEPNILGRDLVFRFGARYRETENFNANYSTRTGTISPGIEFPVSEFGRFAVRYNIDYAEIYNVSADSSIILQQEEDEGALVRTGLGYTYSYDTRTTGIDPRGGVVLRFSQDLNGFGGNSRFVKTGLQAAAERRVLNDEVTLRASFEGGAIAMLSGSDTISDRYLLSSSQLRGFAYGGIGPRDLAVPNRDALGGRYFFVARLEAEFPLGLPEEYGISGGAFFDVGSLWGLGNTNGGPTGTDPVDDSMHLRSAVGLSVFWTTPIGPLRFNFSRPLMKEDYDETQDFDLTISTSF